LAAAVATVAPPVAVGLPEAAPPAAPAPPAPPAAPTISAPPLPAPKTMVSGRPTKAHPWNRRFLPHRPSLAAEN
jgi:hypothetical protein